MAPSRDARTHRGPVRHLAALMTAWAVLALPACAAPRTELGGSEVPAARTALPGCSASYALQSGATLALCGKSLQLQPGRRDAAQGGAPATVLQLQDDAVRGVREFALGAPAVPLGDRPLQAVLLIDTGADTCFGTFVVLIGRDGPPVRWGVLDEVVERDGDIRCVSPRARLFRTGDRLELSIPPPLLLPRPDGSYAAHRQAREHVLVDKGQLIHKPRRAASP